VTEYLTAFLALLTWGINDPNWATLALRIGVGLPFFVSGMDKLFCPICHGWLVANMTRAKLPCVWFLWLAFWEAAAGLMLVLGLFTGASAFILFVICVVAFLTSWRRKLEKAKPAHVFDAFTEVGFMFDVLLAWMVLALMFMGPGTLSLDYLWFKELMP
jgi:uncharacterized membrane protein YphA (DoxX/SURF4 family)